MVIALKYGSEALVNTTANGDQVGNSVIGLANGNAVVIWTDTGPTFDRIRAQLLDPAGDRIGGEFQPHFAPGPNESEPSVAALEGGGFVVARVFTFDGSKRVQAQICDDSGAPVGNQFIVNTTQTNDQDQPSVTALDGGGFVVVWRDNSQTGGDTSFSAIRAQKFGALGAKVGGELLVNTTTPGNQSEPHVTALAGGGFAVSWTDNETFDSGADIGGDGDFDGVRARIFDADGNAAPGDFLVNTTTASSQTTPAMAQLSNGNIVAVYTDSSQTAGDNSQAGVLARILDTAGNEVIAEFLVNTNTLGNQLGASVAALAGGMFLVAWTDAGFFPDGPVEVRAQLFNATGAKIGDEMLVNTTTAGSQGSPSIAVLAKGEVLITWDDFSATGGDTSGSAVRGQVIRLYENVIEGDADPNTITGTAGRDAIFGLGGNDELFGGGGDDHLAGGDGEDTLHGSPGADMLDGGAGLDFVSYANASAGILIDLAAPHLNTGDAAGDRYLSINWFIGSAFDDILLGDDPGNPLRGGGGDDILIGRGGSDQLYGEAGNDVLDGGTGADDLRGGDGDDILDGGASGDDLNGGNGIDTARYASAMAGVTVDLADNSNNAGGALGDVLSFIENLEGSDFNDILRGDDFANTLTGELGNDILVGRGGDDTLIGGPGKDTLIGGAGIDTADYTDKTAGILVMLNGAADATVFVGGVAEDTLREIENVNSGSANDTLVGDSFNNTVTGNGGQDFLFSNGFNPDGTMKAGAGNDTLNGGAGDDGLFAGDGNDTLNGGEGNDGMVGGGGTDTLNGGAGGDFLFGGSFTTAGTFAPGSGNDTLNGGDGNDGLWGQDGNDVIDGDAGDDYVEGGGGNDVINGGVGNDTLLGQDGNDTINGGTGFDYLYGGAGADVFSFRKGDSFDTAWDFSTAQGDKLRLDPTLGVTNFAQFQARLTGFTFEGVAYSRINFASLGSNDEITIGGIAHTAWTAMMVEFA